MNENPTFPILKRYDQKHLLRLAMPLGGIGTGTVSLGGRGNLQDWEIVNRPAKGFTPANAFFALHVRSASGSTLTRCLEGPIHPSQYEGAGGCEVPNHGLPRFRECCFAAAYPLAQVLLDDAELPVSVRLEAFNPFIPADPDASGIPVAVLRYVLTNKTQETLSVAVCGSLQNFIGADGSEAGADFHGRPIYGHKASKNRNEYRAAQGIRGIYMSSAGLDPRAETFGSVALTTITPGAISYRTAWAKVSAWGGDTLLDFWDDFSSDGMLEDRDSGGVDDPTASLAVKVDLPPAGIQAITFLLTWHFPNRQTWTPAPTPPAPAESGSEAGCCSGECQCSSPDTIGNYYTRQYIDAWDAALRTAPRLPELEAQTIDFVRSFVSSDLPEVVKEAALFNLSTLRSQTCFRTHDGKFFGFEGCNNHAGCCHGSCTHVWNYEMATAFLFGSLSRSMREVEFKFSTDERGHGSFRTHLPLGRATEWETAAADGQMGCLIKLYRDWQLSGDDAFLRSLWDGARRALEFCWIPGGWDADRDGVMEGCQHNTMDVEYYGPNPQMTGWYLGALRAAEEMAQHLGEADFAAECHRLFKSGSAWMDAHLFNGEYYEHKIRPAGDASKVAPGLRIPGSGVDNLVDPPSQLGAGCLVDQLVGQYAAHVVGLGYLLKKENLIATLRSILKYNFRKDFYGHFNHLRSFILNDEAGIVMATYPRGRRPRRPFPYYNEVMTGFEYVVGVHLLYEGMEEQGLMVIKAIRDRYDGLKRSPFDEAECGHHYARAMASWSAMLALSGFRYSGVTEHLSVGSKPGQQNLFWSTGDAWGIFHQSPTADGVQVELEVKGGRLPLHYLTVNGVGTLTLDNPRILGMGERITGVI